MSEPVWMGQSIADMSLSHLENTVRYLEQRAKTLCSRNGGSDWRLYTQPVLLDLQAEVEKRHQALSF